MKPTAGYRPYMDQAAAVRRVADQCAAALRRQRQAIFDNDPTAETTAAAEADALGTRLQQGMAQLERLSQKLAREQRRRLDREGTKAERAIKREQEDAKAAWRWALAPMTELMALPVPAVIPEPSRS